MYALESAVAKYKLLNQYSSTCIQAFPVALRSLYLYYCLLYIRTYWHAVHYLLFTRCILLLTLNGVVAWVLFSVVVANEAAPLLRMRCNIIASLTHSRITLYCMPYIILYYMYGSLRCHIRVLRICYVVRFCSDSSYYIYSCITFYAVYDYLSYHRVIYIHVWLPVWWTLLFSRVDLLIINYYQLT